MTEELIQGYKNIIENLELAKQMANHDCKALPNDLRPCIVCMAWNDLWNVLAKNQKE